MSTPTSLRDRIAEALMSWAETNNRPAYAPFRRPETVTQNAQGRAAAVMTVVQPELDRLAAEIARFRTAAQSAAVLLRSIHDRAEAGRPQDTTAIRHAAQALDDARTPTSEPGTDPIVTYWDRTVIPSTPGDDTIVCCLTADGQPVALLLDDEHREALGLQLIDPDGA